MAHVPLIFLLTLVPLPGLVQAIFNFNLIPACARPYLYQHAPSSCDFGSATQVTQAQADMENKCLCVNSDFLGNTARDVFTNCGCDILTLTAKILMVGCASVSVTPVYNAQQMIQVGSGGASTCSSTTGSSSATLASPSGGGSSSSSGGGALSSSFPLPSSSNAGNGGGLPGWAIALIVVGSILIAGKLGIGLWLIIAYKKKRWPFRSRSTDGHTVPPESRSAGAHLPISMKVPEVTELEVPNDDYTYRGQVSHSITPSNRHELSSSAAGNPGNDQ